MRIVEGRAFRDTDGPDAPRVAIVNATLAKRYYAGRNPVGAHLQFAGSTDKPLEIVGVVADTRTEELSRVGRARDLPAVLAVGRVLEASRRPRGRRSDGARGARAQRAARDRPDVRRRADDDDGRDPARVGGVAHVRDAAAHRLCRGRDAAGARRPLWRAVAVGQLADQGDCGAEGRRRPAPPDRPAGAGRRLEAGGRRARCSARLSRCWSAGCCRRCSSTSRRRIRWRSAIAAIAFGVVALAACLVPAYRASRVDLMESLRQE